LFRYFERLQGESLPESFKELEFLIGRVMNNVKYSSANPSDGDGLKRLLQQTRQELVGIAAAFNQYYFGNS
jgi:hypothetical protein